MKFDLFITLVTEAAVDALMLGLIRRKYTVSLDGLEKMEYAVFAVLDLEAEKSTEEVRSDVQGVLEECGITSLSMVFRSMARSSSMLWNIGFVPKSVQERLKAIPPPKPVGSALDRIDEALKGDS